MFYTEIFKYICQLPIQSWRENGFPLYSRVQNVVVGKVAFSTYITTSIPTPGMEVVMCVWKNNFFLQIYPFYALRKKHYSKNIYNVAVKIY